MNAELAKHHLRRLMRESEPQDYSELDGFLGALAITLLLALGLYSAGMLILVFAQ